jgi:hypothetical protein
MIIDLLHPGKICGAIAMLAVGRKNRSQANNPCKCREERGDREEEAGLPTLYI